jgi:aminopeptidase N
LNHKHLGHTCCRRIESSALAYRPFVLPGDKPHYAPDREYALQHIFLDIALDFETKTVSGTVSTTFTPVNDDLSEIHFDSRDTIVSKVTVAGEAVALNFSHDKGKLKINLAKPRAADVPLSVVIEFKSTPRKGLYFIAPDKDYPNKHLHAWTQGQDTDNHYWFPCFDAPNQKATTEIRVRVPQTFYALSNGKLLAEEDDTATKTKIYHWKQTIPHSTYLITLVAGEFVEIMDKWEDIPVPYYVLPGQEEKAKVSLTNTPAMVGYFSAKIGVRYPYEKYATVCVQDFIFGGMENTTATTLTEYTLHDARAHQDYDSDPLLSHELAHQWFGDLLTCRDWSHGWLNEGFATYFEAIWTEQNSGKDEAMYYMYQTARSYLDEDSNNYRRAIVTNTFNEPIDLFDSHLYEKGGCVLHMIRWILGDKLWWKAINHYVNKHRGQNVITADWERAIEEATGRNLQPFFEQWVYKGGHPEFKLSYSWDDDTKMVKFGVSQTHKQDELTPLFTYLSVEIAFVGESGKRESFRVKIEEKEHNFYFKVAEKPLFASFDPENWLLKTVEWERPKEMLIAQLEKDTISFGRIVAAQALSKFNDANAIAALEKALINDAFWAVRAECASALGKINANAAEKALLSALESEKNAKVRRAIVSALGEFKTESSAVALAKVLSGDVTDSVESAAATALGKTRQPLAFEALQKALERDSFNQVVRSGAFSGFSQLKDEKALPLALEWSQYGKPEQARYAAVSVLGNLGKLVKDKEKEQVIDRLVELLDDVQWRTRLTTISAVETLGDQKPLTKLSRIAQTGLDGREVRRSREAIEHLHQANPTNAELKTLREQVDKLQTENRTLLERLEAIEQKLK